MVDPLSLVTTILAVVKLIGTAALTARQNKRKCLALARRARNLGDALPDFAKAAGNNTATVHGLERLRDALNEAFRLIESCQEGRRSGGIFSCVCSSPQAAELDDVDRQINNCLSDLNFFSLARGQTMVAQHVTVPPQTCAYGFPPPQYATVNVQYSPGPAPYTAPPATSGFNPSSLYTLPTVNKVFARVFR